MNWLKLFLSPSPPMLEQSAGDFYLSLAERFLLGQLDISSLTQLAQNYAPAQSEEASPPKIAVVNINGAILETASPIDNLFGFVGADQIATQIMAAGQSEARAVLTVTRSPGGVMTAASPIQEAIEAVKASKPVVNYTPSLRASLALLATAGTNESYVDKKAQEGSVGTVLRHVNRSEMLKQMGVNVEYIQAGEKKTYGAADVELSQEAREHIQAKVDQANAMFISEMLEARSSLSNDSSTWATGETFFAQESVQLGFSDGISTMRGLLGTPVLKKAMQKSVNVGLEQTAVKTLTIQPVTINFRKEHMSKLTALLQSATEENQPSLEQINQAHADDVSAAVEAEQAKIAAALGLESYSLEEVGKVKQKAAEGDSYRASLIKQGKELQITIHGQDAGPDRAETWEEAHKGASIAVLEAAVKHLEQDRDAMLPNTQLSNDADDKGTLPKPKVNTRYA